jgi:hypothetical protein
MVRGQVIKLRFLSLILWVSSLYTILPTGIYRFPTLVLATIAQSLVTSSHNVGGVGMLESDLQGHRSVGSVAWYRYNGSSRGVT